MNKLDIQAKLQEELSTLSLEELNLRFDDMGEKISNYKAKFTEEAKEKLIKLYNSGLYTLDYQHAKFFRMVFDKIKTSEVVELELVEFRNVQQLIMSCKFSNPIEAAIIDDVLDVTKGLNEDLYEFEASTQVLAYEIERRKTEEAAGLKFTEEDNSIVEQLDVRPTPIVEAGKNSEEKVIIDEEK